MHAEPKRRGRPPRPVPAAPPPAPRYRLKAVDLHGAVKMQVATVHPTGIEWRDMPVVSIHTPDWETV